MTQKHTIQITEVVSSELLNWMEAFLLDGHTRGLSLTTLRFYREGLERFLQFCARMQIDALTDITPNVIRQYVLYLENRGHNAGGVHAKFRTVRAFFNWIELELNDPQWHNPMRKIRVRLPKLDPLEPAEIQAVKAMLETCEVKPTDPQWKKRAAFTNLRDKLIIYVLLDTGLRSSELCALTMNNINPITGSVQVLKGKGGKPRTVYIGRKTRQILRKYIREYGQEFLFYSINGERLNKNTVHQLLERRAKLAGVPNQPPHSFRRLFALTMLRAGVDIYSLKQSMGHESLQVLQLYLKITEDDTREAHAKGSPVERLL